MHDSQPPPQHQDRQPGLEAEMTPRPKSEAVTHQGTGKLRGKVALITGGRQRHRTRGRRLLRPRGSGCHDPVS